MQRVSRTIISQYSSAATIVEMVQRMNDAISPDVNIQGFYDWCWNVDTAFGKGLDIWGKIVGVPRLLKIPGDLDTFGFINATIPYDWQPFNQGTFYAGNIDTQAYLLPDDTYRTLILTKALANIVATTAQNLNKLLRNLFPGRGRCYVVDNGAMSMTFTFEFELSAAEYAILTQSGVLPHPAGVSYNVHVIPSATYLGFSEALPNVMPFDYGVFYDPPSPPAPLPEVNLTDHSVISTGFPGSGNQQPSIEIIMGANAQGYDAERLVFKVFTGYISTISVDSGSSTSEVIESDEWWTGVSPPVLLDYEARLTVLSGDTPIGWTYPAGTWVSLNESEAFRYQWTTILGSAVDAEWLIEIRDATTLSVLSSGTITARLQ